jgi:sugar transferase (PEP-CTERM system associated)
MGEFVSTFRFFNHHVRVPFLLLGLFEAGIVLSSVYLAAYIRFVGKTEKFEAGLGDLIWHALIVSGLFIIIFVSMGLYQSRMRDGIKGILLRLIIAYCIGIIVLNTLFYILPSLYIGRGLLFLILAISFIVILNLRYLILKTGGDIFKRRILVLGTGKKALSITELKRKSDKIGFVLIGYVHLRGTKDEVDKDKIVDLKMSLKDYCLKNEVDEIVLAVEDRRKTFPVHELLDCRMSGVDITELATFFEREIGKLKIDLLHPSWFITSSGFEKGIFYDATKRIFDLFVGFALLLITWPFMLFTVIAIKFEDGLKASILYKQIRIGKNNKPYHVYKFRSMQENAEKMGKARWADKRDSRITKLGTFLRKARIDELPQIFNVLKGEMSFVGPRPERPLFVVELSEKVPYYAERHRVKPGITGWAQICYPYGSSIKDAFEKLQYDLYYVKNYSIFLDLLILLQTAEVILFGKGAR